MRDVDSSEQAGELRSRLSARSLFHLPTRPDIGSTLKPPEDEAPQDTHLPSRALRNIGRLRTSCRQFSGSFRRRPGTQAPEHVKAGGSCGTIRPRRPTASGRDESPSENTIPPLCVDL